MKTSLIRTVKNGAINNKLSKNIMKESKFGIKSIMNLVLRCIKPRRVGLIKLSIILKTDSEKNCNKTIARTKESEGTEPKNVSFIS